MGKIAKNIEVVPEPVKPDKPIEPDYNAIRAAIREKDVKLNERFDKVKEALKAEMIPLNYETWIEPLVAVKFEKPVLTLYSEPFSASWVMEHFKGRIEEKTDCEINVVAEAPDE